MGIKCHLSEKVTNNKKVMAIFEERIDRLNMYAMHRIRKHPSRPRSWGSDSSITSEDFSCVVLDEIIIDDRRRGEPFQEVSTFTHSAEQIKDLHKWILRFRKGIMDEHKTLEDRIRVIGDPKSFKQDRFKKSVVPPCQ